jgi:hypothetical protein
MQISANWNQNIEESWSALRAGLSVSKYNAQPAFTYLLNGALLRSVPRSIDRLWCYLLQSDPHRPRRNKLRPAELDDLQMLGRGWDLTSSKVEKLGLRFRLATPPKYACNPNAVVSELKEPSAQNRCGEPE